MLLTAGRHDALPTLLALPMLAAGDRGGGPKVVTIGMPAEYENSPNVMWLVPLDGPLAGETLRIEPSIGSTIGREPPADIIIPDDAIATPHAHITPAATIYDLDSPGTYVNDQQITKFDLVDNDIIRIGGTRLLFKSA
jgi:hypothetical protein